MIKFLLSILGFRPLNTDTIIQVEGTECGAVSLAIILAYYKLYVPIEELRVNCGVGRDGANLFRMVKAAEHYNLKTDSKKVTLEDMHKVRTPAILFWGFNHFVVFEGVVNNKYYINDPAGGPRHMTREEFSRKYTGIVLELTPTSEFASGGKKASTLRWLISRMSNSRRAFLGVLLFSILLVMPGLLNTGLTKAFYDDILVDMRYWLHPFLTIMALGILFMLIFSWFKKYYILRMHYKLSITSSLEFLCHCLRLPFQYFGQRFPGDISSRVDLNSKVANLIANNFASNFLNLFLVVIYGAVMFCYDTSMALVGVGAVVANIGSLMLVRRFQVDLNKNSAQQIAKLMGVGSGGLQIIETFKATGRESSFFSTFADSQVKVINCTQRLGYANNFVKNIPTFVSSCSSAVLILVGGLNVMDGAITMGDLLAFQLLMSLFISPVGALARLLNSLQLIEGDTMRLNDVLQNRLDPLLENVDLLADKSGIVPATVKDKSRESEQNVENVDKEQKPVFSRITKSLEFRNVTFGYCPLNQPLIEDFSMKIEVGQTVALVGGSGSGKTTIIRLAAGLIQPQSGEIFYDGIPIQKIPHSVLATSMSLVTQKASLFAGTIRDNITMWNDCVPNNNIITALRDAQIFDAVLSRPGGLNADAGQSGCNFSGGEAQRIEIARALATNPSVLIFDEATNALDSVSEKEIYRSVKKRECLCMISAHRLSAIRDSDEIIVFNEGIVVERGKHEELMANKRFYTNLISTGE